MTKTLVDNPYALYTLLAKKYGNRFNADPFLAMRGRIDGTIDSKKILSCIKRMHERNIPIDPDAFAVHKDRKYVNELEEIMKANKVFVRKKKNIKDNDV